MGRQRGMADSNGESEVGRLRTKEREMVKRLEEEERGGCGARGEKENHGLAERCTPVGVRRRVYLPPPGRRRALQVPECGGAGRTLGRGLRSRRTSGIAFGRPRPHAARAPAPSGLTHRPRRADSSPRGQCPG